MQSSFVAMIETGQGFGKILQGLTTQLADFLLKSIVFKQIAGMFGTTGVGGVIGSFFSGLAGARATGGPVTAGSLYLVGEQGPELFSPGNSGSIIPNSAMASVSRASGGNTYIDARGADAGVEARVMRAIAKSQKQASGQSLVSVHDFQARGGIL